MILINNEKSTGIKFPTVKKVKVYELVEAYHTYDPYSKRTVKPSKFSLLPFYTRFNPEKNESEQLRYVESTNVAQDGKGNIMQKHLPHRLIFTNGLLVVPIDRPELVYFMDNHPDNEKVGGSRSVFREVNKEQFAQKKVNERRMKFMAEQLLYGEKPMSESKMYKVLAAHNVGVDVSEFTAAEVLQQLSVYAEQDPEQFVKTAQGSDIDIKWVISECVKNQKLKFVKKESKWVWGDMTMTPDGEVVKVPQGYNELDFLVSFLIKQENIDTLTELELQLENKSFAK